MTFVEEAVKCPMLISTQFDAGLSTPLPVKTVASQETLWCIFKEEQQA